MTALNYDQVQVEHHDGTLGPPVQECLAECRRELDELRALVKSQAKTIEGLEVEVAAWRNTQIVLEARERTEVHPPSNAPVEDDDDYTEIR